MAWAQTVLERRPQEWFSLQSHRRLTDWTEAIHWRESCVGCWGCLIYLRNLNGYILELGNLTLALQLFSAIELMIDRRLVQMRLTKHLGLALAPKPQVAARKKGRDFFGNNPMKATHMTSFYDVKLKIHMPPDVPSCAIPSFIRPR